MNSLYILREGLSGFGRAKLATIGSIITIVLSLLLLGSFYIVSTNTARIGDSVRERVEMEAFLREPVSQQQIDDIRSKIGSLEGVDRVQFVSKDDAAKVFQREFGENIKDVLDFNPLPPSFKIFLQEKYRTSSHVEDIQKKIKSIAGVDDVVYGKEMLEFI